MLFVSIFKRLILRLLRLLTQTCGRIIQETKKSGPNALFQVIFIEISEAGKILPMIAASAAPLFFISSSRFPAVS